VNASQLEAASARGETLRSAGFCPASSASVNFCGELSLSVAIDKEKQVKNKYSSRMPR
jgi:hypothetical protein